MISEIDRRRGQARGLASKMRGEDQIKIGEFLDKPARLIKEKLAERVKKMVDMGYFPKETVYTTEGVIIINGISLYSPDYSNERSESPFVFENGKLYICQDKREHEDGKKLADWSSRVEARPIEYIQYGQESLQRLSTWIVEAIGHELDPVNPYAFD